MTIEKVSQDEMLHQFGEKFKALSEENQKLAAKIKENEVTMLKLQGAIETLEYYKEEETASAPPDEETEE
tara:strand:+ start:176 stop:385 length:210 start_codon:yes stop_codon:yes gene_type:complete